MKVYVFSHSTLCVGVSNPDLSKLEDVWYEHGFVDKFNLAAREVQFIWHVLAGACTVDIQKHIQKDLNGQTPESFDERNILMSMFNDVVWTKRRQHTNLFAQRQRSGSICDPIQARTLVLPGARVRTFVVERTFQRTSRKMKHYLIADGWHVQVWHVPPDVSSDRATVAWTVEEKKKWPFPMYVREQEVSHQDHTGKQFTLYLQKNLPVVWDWKPVIYTENIGRRRANRFRTRAVAANNATSSRRLVVTTHGESWDADSESWRTGRTVDNGQSYTTNESVVDGNSSTPLCRECSEPKNSLVVRVQAVDDHGKIRPVNGIEVFKSAGTLVIEVQVPSQQPGSSESWVRISRRTEQYARQCVPAETDHQHPEAASSLQSISCGRPRAQETGGNSPVR